ncbi:MAG: hypothetical protein K0S38_800 [Candidatus Paceibacter sp.]|jgi:hypothetical protein|nr:hypothetical protein [Candidatus Paceibacter sp.]
MDNVSFDEETSADIPSIRPFMSEQKKEKLTPRKTIILLTISILAIVVAVYIVLMYQNPNRFSFKKQPPFRPATSVIPLP